MTDIVKRISECSECKRKGLRSPKHDSYFCEHCNIWLEAVCDKPSCTVCHARPSKPLEVVCTS